MNDFMKKVKSVLSGIGEKAGQTCDIGKLELEKRTHARSIAKEIQKIGESVLECSEQGRSRIELDEDPFRKYLKDIRFHKEKIGDLQVRIDEVRERK